MEDLASVPHPFNPAPVAEVRRPSFLADIPIHPGRRPGFLGGGELEHRSDEDDPLPVETTPLPPEPAPARVDQYVRPAPPPVPAPSPSPLADAAPLAPPPGSLAQPVDAPPPATPAVLPPERDAAPADDDRLQSGLEILRRTAEALAEQARGDALEIGLLVAQHIIGQELKTNIEPVLRMVRDALRQTGDARQVEVHLHPTQAQRLTEAQAEGHPDTLSIAQVAIVGDAKLDVGDIEVETEFGVIDGRLARRFDDIRRTLKSNTPGTPS